MYDTSHGACPMRFRAWGGRARLSALWDGDDASDRGVESTADGTGHPWDRGVGGAGERAAVGVGRSLVLPWVFWGGLGRFGEVRGWAGEWVELVDSGVVLGGFSETRSWFWVAESRDVEELRWWRLWKRR